MGTLVYRSSCATPGTGRPPHSPCTSQSPFAGLLCMPACPGHIISVLDVTSVSGMDLPVHNRVIAGSLEICECSIEGCCLLLLQTWPLCFTVNHDNYGYRKPINPLIDDLQACEQLYDKTLKLINSKAATRIKGLPS